MSVSSTGNTYSTSASSSNGMSGLASGLDTDGMVEALLAGTQAKIDKQEGLKQQTLWKQEIYRSLISKINSFKNKYFSSSSSTSLLNQSFFNQMSAVTTASAFKATATSSAASGKTTLEVVQLATNSKLTGAAASGKLSGTLDQTKLDALMSGTDDITLNITLDDNLKTITIDRNAISDGNGGVDTAKLQTELQNKINKTHGNNQLTVDISNGEINITTNNIDGRKVMVSGTTDVLGALGFQNGQSNRIGLGGTLAQNYFNTPLDGDTFKFTINGVDFEFDNTATVTEVMNKINASDAGVRMTYRALDDKFSLEATDSGGGFGINFSDTAGNLMEAMFGVASSDNTGDDGGYVYNEGVNAKVVIDGVETERSSNSFTVNGINIELKAANVGVTETIEVSRDTDSVIAGIKSFMEDYNALIDELNSLTREDANYKKYAPLTDAQKKEMSEREIELWEEKAKEGLMHNDSALSTFLQSMRTALYERPEGGLYAIYDLGIETSSEWKDYGKLVFSTDGEAKLRQAIESNPDDVIRLFTDEKEGLSVKMEKILKDTANTSSASRGTLVQIAGVENAASDYDNDLYDRLKIIERKIDQLKAAYEKEKTRYWNQFNAMESYISNMNSQSSWLTQQLSS